MDYRTFIVKVAETFTFCAAPPTLHRQLQDIISAWKKHTFSSEE